MSAPYREIVRALVANYQLESIEDAGFYYYRRGRTFVLFSFNEHLSIYLISDPATIALRRSQGQKPIHRQLIDAYIRPRRRCGLAEAFRITRELDKYPKAVIEYCDPQMLDIIERILASTKGS